MIEEPAYNPEPTFAFEHPSALLLVQFSPGEIKRNVRPARRTLKFREQRCDIWAWSRARSLLGSRFGFSGITKSDRNRKYCRSPGTRASAVRVVEGKQPRFGLLVAQVGLLTLKTLRKMQPLEMLTLTRGGFEDDLTCLSVADLYGIHDTGTGVRTNDETIDRAKIGRLNRVKQRLRSGKFENLAYSGTRRLKPRWRSRNRRVLQLIGERGGLAPMRRLRDAPRRRPMGGRRCGWGFVSLLGGSFGLPAEFRFGAGTTPLSRAPSPSASTAAVT